jgi:hypothetical protein
VPSATPTWLVEARQAVERASDDRQFQERLDQLVDIDDALTDMIDKLAELTAAAEAGRSSWWAGADLPQNVLAGLTALRKNIVPRQWATVRRALEQLLSKVESEIRGAWQNHIAGVAGNAGDMQNLVRVLGTAPGLAAVASELEVVLGELARQRRKLPDVQSMAAVQSAAELLDELENRLPVDVKVFVSAAARGAGASLDLLTAGVLVWLTENGAASEFRIVVAAKGRGQSRG